MDEEARKIVRTLGLKPLGPEGGYYRETYRSREAIPDGFLPRRYRGPRALSTSIYYLVTPGQFSAIHRLRSDEVYHFYHGDPVELYIFGPGRRSGRMVLGDDLKRGLRPQAVVPLGRWQGARLVPGGRFALLGTTVSPGFDFRDLEVGARKRLLESFPGRRGIIEALTREPG